MADSRTLQQQQMSIRGAGSFVPPPPPCGGTGCEYVGLDVVHTPECEEN